jgi:hypothetical protein
LFFRYSETCAAVDVSRYQTAVFVPNGNCGLVAPIWCGGIAQGKKLLTSGKESGLPKN